MGRIERLIIALAVLLIPWLDPLLTYAQPQGPPPPVPAPDAKETLSSPRPVEEKSPLEVPAPPGGEAIPLKPPPLEPGDMCFPINLATALRLADARPIIVAIAQAKAWVSEAEFQKAKVLWVPTLNLGFDYIRHDGYGPDLNRGTNVPQGVNALGQPSPGSLGKPINQNVNFFYGGGGFTLSPLIPNYFFQPLTAQSLLPSPQSQFTSDLIFEPLRTRQILNSRRWDIQGAKNDALFQTARAYFNVHRFRGVYAVALDVVERGRRLVAEISLLSEDLVPKVEIERARNLLADLEQQAVLARQAWRVASANLTQVLRLDPPEVVEPLESDHMQITLIDPDRPLDELIPIGLTNRPELASHQALVQAQLVAIRREKLKPFAPAILINGFQTPYELLEVGGYGVGNGGKLNNWSGRLDFSPQFLWIAQNMGLGNLAAIKEQRGLTSGAIVELFKIQDSVAGDITRVQADLQSAAARVVQSERQVRAALVNYNGSYEGLKQTKRFGNVLIQVFRPQEVVFALQLLWMAYDNYIVTVAEYNIAQFALFHALGYPAKELSFDKPPGEIMPVDTSRPGYLPPVGTGPPPASR